MSSPVAKAARRVTHELHGVVVSAGLMEKTAKVRVGGQKWNKIVHKVRLDAQTILKWLKMGLADVWLLIVVR